MDAQAIKGLSDIERKMLAMLGHEGASEQEISTKAGLSIDSVRRAGAWLSEKGLAMASEAKAKTIGLTRLGEQYLKEGLPEQKMLTRLNELGPMTFSETIASAGLSKPEFSAALGENKRDNFIAIAKDGAGTKLQITEVGKAFCAKGQFPSQTGLAAIASGKECNEAIAKRLSSRGLVEERVQSKRKISITPLGEEALASKEFSSERAYDVRGPAPDIFCGKRQPYTTFLNKIRRKLTELGFVEMDAPLIVHEFYNFDSLFQPQNHPARAWSDTYQLKSPTHGNLPDKKAIEAIRQAHENGGISGSKGWGYKWSEEIASKVMPTAHGTAHSARQLTKGVKVPGKYFAIARCFRPDVPDATHLIEFNQTEGFIVGEDLNFRHLLGILEQFAKEIAGAEEVKFYPDYYPFTEPSCELLLKHPKLGWIETGGAGIFRPEITESLGIKEPVLAWGLGLDRLAMIKLNITDIRQLFSDDLGWLRKTPLI